MTPAQAAARLTAAEHSARGAGDGGFTAASDLADPAEIYGAADEASARALAAEFLVLAESMQELDVDAATIGDALDTVTAEAEVAEAARRVKAAELRLADAREQLDIAWALPENDPCNGCHSAKAAAIEDAQQAVRAAECSLKDARDRLREALTTAADIAASMRAGLYRRHGDLHEAHQSAPVRAAERQFYGAGAR